MSDKHADFDDEQDFHPTSDGAEDLNEQDLHEAMQDMDKDLAQDVIRDAMTSDDDYRTPSEFMADIDREMGLDPEEPEIGGVESLPPTPHQEGSEVIITKEKIDLIMSLLRSLVDAVETIEVRLDNHRDAIETTQAQISSFDGTLRILFEHIEKGLR